VSAKIVLVYGAVVYTVYS